MLRSQANAFATINNAVLRGEFGTLIFADYTPRGQD